MAHTTSPKHDRAIEDGVDGMEVDEAPRQEKRQKKKQVTRKPLCTFVNYLAVVDPSDEATVKKKNSAPIPEDAVMDDASCASSGVSSQMKKLSLESRKVCIKKSSNDDDTSSTTSVETVNTSNKSVDACQRDDRFRTQAATPAMDRWKEPPPPLPKTTDVDDAFYVTSKCDSDSESDSEGGYRDRPKEIVIRKKYRCPRLQRFQGKHNARKKYNALPKFGTVKLYKI